MSGVRMVNGALVVLVLLLTPSVAAAQAGAAAPAANGAGKPWFGAGLLSTTAQGDCTDCEPERYLHTGSLLVNGGWTLNDRADLGAEIMWVASQATNQDRIRVTFIQGVVQFRPWRTRGFLLRGGGGMGFVHNWILNDGTEVSAFRSKALALEIGAGWEWRLGRRFGVQLIGAQHVAALGDLETSTRTVENVIGNFWSVGGAFVIR